MIRSAAICACASLLLNMITVAHAAQTPVAGRLDRRVTNVVFQPGNVVQISAMPGISTMIIFDEDERFETIALGDSDSWDVVPTEKGNILFVKPKARQVATNMNVVTSKRIYYLALTDHPPNETNAVFGVRFVYPDKALNTSLRKDAETRAAYPNITGIDKANINLDYSFSGTSDLKPLVVFDDGQKTFFRFSSRQPAIFAVNADFSETLINARREGDYLVIDGTSPQYTLRDGHDWTCIFNLRKPDIGAPDPAFMGPYPDKTASHRTRSGN